ncbi:glycosyltransferase family 4 protein [Asticcacaulis sp. AC402]|uniref:glycosyltransferase family 4 protein n=1 Tax=Asticcacaulis sp. AC402 TaxID=1282361 RepID=UPI0003C40748|nr:glycosyltransferase family 4 protein [Asticcacaulis sp. AC402]ESQ74970.1 glycosyl transferase family 1 [Asticcacaulis sp. AC402]
MKILLIHQNMPGQFKHLAPLLATAGHDVRFITKRKEIEIPGVTKLLYEPHREVRENTHHYMRQFENGLLHGQAVTRICQDLRKEGWRPDLVMAHPGWGETLFVKESFPNSPLISYCEFYYASKGADFGFDPATSTTFDDHCRIRARNAHLLLSLELCDAGWSPTQWQMSRHPKPFQDKINVIFDGIDTNTARPNPNAKFVLADGRVLTPQDEVITYVARNLEPYRGFPTFMRALPELLKARPNATLLVCGATGVSYGSKPKRGDTWKDVMLEETGLPSHPDFGRVHFLGHLPYARYISLLQVSSAHIYLTYPFVLSWSFMEAMSAGCRLIASNTAPVLEVLKDGENGWLTDFFDPGDLVVNVVRALEDPNAPAIRAAARETILGCYDLKTCVPKQLQMIERVSRMPVVLKTAQSA